MVAQQGELKRSINQILTVKNNKSGDEQKRLQELKKAEREKELVDAKQRVEFLEKELKKEKEENNVQKEEI